MQRDFEELPSEAFRPLRDSLNVSENAYNLFFLLDSCYYLFSFTLHLLEQVVTCYNLQ